MPDYRLLRSPASLDMVQRMIQARIDQLTEKQWSLTGDDYRRCKITLDYNRRLLKDPNATVRFDACR